MLQRQARTVRPCACSLVIRFGGARGEVVGVTGAEYCGGGADWDAHQSVKLAVVPESLYLRKQ